MAGPQGGAVRRPYRFLLSRRWVGLLVVALLVALGCVLLGRWQLDRLGQRHERNDLLRRNLTSAPVAPGELLAVGREPRDGDQFARVRAAGRYDEDRRLLVRTRPFQGRVGYYVLSPFVTDAGPALLVVRGWVPGGPTAESLPDVPPPPSGEVTVTARIRQSEPPSTTGTPPEGQVTRIDVPAIATTLPYPVYGGYGEVTAEQPRLRDRPERLPAPEPSEGPHLAYAFQWFLFALLALGGYVVLARREETDLAAGTTREQPVTRVRVRP
jgi:cytochrome oxidase assembly protein ShyY1